MGSPEFRLGLRVEDVPTAVAFYGGLGFDELGSIPDESGRPVMAILERSGVQLVVDVLEGMPFPDSERERRTKAGPRGLGVAIGLGVADLEATFEYCKEAGCLITCEPMDEAWGTGCSSASIPSATSGSSHIRAKELHRPILWARSARAGSASSHDSRGGGITIASAGLERHAELGEGAGSEGATDAEPPHSRGRARGPHGILRRDTAPPA